MPELETYHLNSVDKNNLLNLNRFLSDEYNHKWLGAGDFADGDGHVVNTAEIASALMLEASAAAELGATFRRPTFWINGYFILTLYWSTTQAAGDTALDLDVYGNIEGASVFGGSTSLYTAQPTLATSGANELQVTSYSATSTLLTGEMPLISVILGRDGTAGKDTSTGNFKLHGVDFEFKPQVRR